MTRTQIIPEVPPQHGRLDPTLITGGPSPSPAAPAVSGGSGGAGASCVVPRLSLTDFLDMRTLRELQESFSAVAKVRTTILDSSGKPLLAPTEAGGHPVIGPMIEQLIAPEMPGSHGALGPGQPLIAPIVVEGQELGSIRIECPETPATPADRAAVEELCRKLNVPDEQCHAILTAAEEAFAPKQYAVVQTLFLLANQLARLCYQGYQLRERVEELAAINKLSELLAGARDVQQVLDTAVRTASQVMNVKASSIRLFNEETRDIEVKAVYNLSPGYVTKGPVNLDRSDIAKGAFAGELVYVEDMRTDPRVVYPDDAEREGLVSFLVAGMIYRGRPLGLFQVYSGHLQRFSRFDLNLLQSIAQLTATAIANARLDTQRKEADKVKQQVRLAADVQRRMLPSTMPQVPPFDVAARYVPSFELGGDFYDFIELEGHLGVGIGDVVGKGIAASLLMASVRASLRAFAQDVYDIDEIMARINLALSRDTLTNEFATLFYGVLDPSTLRMTYSNAGHEPPLLLRKGKIIQLDVGGTVLGIDANHHYEKGLISLEPGDLMLLYTDGLCDAVNFDMKRFGRERVKQALLDMDGKSAQEALNHILWQMRRFVGLRASIDDTTLVTIKVNKPAKK